MRSRKNNTTLTRKVDKWNARKVWLIKHYADGHYAINQEIGGRVFYSGSCGTSSPPSSNRNANATVRNSAFKSCAKTRLGPRLSVSARNQRRSSANEIPYC